MWRVWKGPNLMASIHDADDEYAQSRYQGSNAQAPVYSVGNSGDGIDGDEWFKRGERQGPLAARLSRRQRNTPEPTTGANRYQHFTRSPYSESESPVPQASAGAPPAYGYEPGYDPQASRQRPTWEKVTSALRLEETAASPDALFTDLGFGATWNSRAEMLRACLDEYYRVVNSFNDARRLLEISESDLEPLRRDQMVADARVREAEARLEFQSRTELRSIYLGAAEIETRLFRAEQEHQSLSNRLEVLEGFMTFLSRIIATVRAIPEGALLRDTGVTPGVQSHSDFDAHIDSIANESTMLMNPDLINTVDLQPTMLAVNRTQILSILDSADATEKLTESERETPFQTSSEVKAVEALDTGETETPETPETPA